MEFITLVAHWADYADAGYLSFIDDAQPDIAQVGFYGAHFWSLAHTPFGKGYPAHLPVQGLAECGDWFTHLNAQLHRRKRKVIGHFNVKFLVGDPESPEGPRGFFKFYRDLWDEKELGPKPVENSLDLLEKNADGSPIVNHNYQIGGMAEYWGCLNNPHFRAVLKAWVRRGIERGLDGFMINYFYRHNCLCDHCQREFRAYLARHFKPEELTLRFGMKEIPDRFPEIVSWHSPDESTPLRREMLRFSQIANKHAFDEIFVIYGRSLKPGLLVAQWNHLGDFAQISGDERCLLPAELWGKGEDYLWYSSGSSAHFTDLKEGYLGEVTLQARYVRGMFEDKPFTFGKYESTRIRTAIAELAANGGAPMGFYTSFIDPLARREIVRYYGFLRRYDALYRANQSCGEAVLLYPRKRVLQGDVKAVESFKKFGRSLLDQHVLFDVLSDDKATASELSRYPWMFQVASEGGLEAAKPAEGGLTQAAGPWREGGPDSKILEEFSRFEAPATVRVSVSRPASGGELDIHFVNYNRQEPETKRSPGGGIADEKPVAVTGIRAAVLLPAGFRVASAQAIWPESADPVSLEIEVREGRARFTMPEFLVYAVARLVLEKAP